MNIIEISEEDKTVVRESYNKSKEDIKQDVEIIKEWLKKQPHLPPTSDDEFIERILIRTKFRIEKAKKCIDSYFTVKTIWPELYQGMHKIVPSEGCALYYPSDQLTDGKELVLIFFMKSPPDQYDIFEVSRITIAYLELILKCDYSLGIHVVWDFSRAEIGHMKKLIDINLAQKVFTVILTVYSIRFKGLHMLRPPSWISAIMNLLKNVIPKKIMERVFLHNSNDSLLEVIPKQCLPIEYGGSNKSVQELIKRMDELFVSNKKFLMEVQKMKSKEKLRIGDCGFQTNTFGTDGTFKKLNID